MKSILAIHLLPSVVDFLTNQFFEISHTSSQQRVVARCFDSLRLVTSLLSKGGGRFKCKQLRFNFSIW